MASIFDAIVIGCGGVGSAAMHSLARRGWRVLGLDQFSPPHDRGSTHGQTRIIRQAYFEHADYVPLVLRAYDLWRDLESACGRTLFHRVGLLQVGPADGAVIRGVLSSAARHRLAVEELSATDVARRFPAFRVPEGSVGAYEPAAGFLRVEDCVSAFLEQAQNAGAELRTGVIASDWTRLGESAESGDYRVTTDQGEFLARRLVVTAGPWAGRLLADIGVPLVVRRKPIYWFACSTSDQGEYQAAAGCPTFLFETPSGVFYGFPQFDARGVKVARHSGGAIVDDPTTVDRTLDQAELDDVSAFVRACLPKLGESCREHATCMYTMSPDEHFIVDVHPRDRGVVFAAGLSGHGYKFAPVLGEVLADLAERGETDQPIDFLRAGRFRCGE